MNGVHPSMPNLLPITTELYTLGVGEDKDGKPMYEVMNTETGVVEYDDYILPRSIEALDNLTEKLVEVQQRRAKTTLALVGEAKGETDGKGSLH